MSAKSGLDLKAGDIAWVNVDKAMLDDILGTRVQIAEHLPKLSTGIKNVDNVVVISDHYTPPATIKQAEIVKFTRDWSKEQGIKNYYEFKGTLPPSHGGRGTCGSWNRGTGYGLSHLYGWCAGGICLWCWLN